jgi:hypothetical protein
MSRLSFSPKDEAIGRIFRANIENQEFKPLFLVALARENPADYLDALAKAVRENTVPRTSGGGSYRRSRRGRSSSDTFKPSRPTRFVPGSRTAF